MTMNVYSVLKCFAIRGSIVLNESHCHHPKQNTQQQQPHHTISSEKKVEPGFFWTGTEGVVVNAAINLPVT
jgi:hypothetical protein